MLTIVLDRVQFIALFSDETPMRPGRGSHVMDGKQHLSTLKISFPWEMLTQMVLADATGDKIPGRDEKNK